MNACAWSGAARPDMTIRKMRFRNAREEPAVTFSLTEWFYVALGLLSIAALLYFNRGLLRGGISALEIVYYLAAAAGLLIGWYFNFQYLREYGTQAGWAHWTRLLFVNPASASGGQDLIIANVVLYPLWTIVDGRRVGLRASGLFFFMSLLTSYAFAVALYLGLRERRLRTASPPRVA